MLEYELRKRAVVIEGFLNEATGLLRQYLMHEHNMLLQLAELAHGYDGDPEVEGVR